MQQERQSWAVAPRRRGAVAPWREIVESSRFAPQDAQLAKALQTTNEGHDPRLPDLGTVNDDQIEYD